MHYDVYVRMFMVLVYAGLFGGAFVARMASGGIPHFRRCMVTCRRELDGVHLDSIISASRIALIIRAGFYYDHDCICNSRFGFRFLPLYTRVILSFYLKRVAVETRLGLTDCKLEFELEFELKFKLWIRNSFIYINIDIYSFSTTQNNRKYTQI